MKLVQHIRNLTYKLGAIVLLSSTAQALVEPKWIDADVNQDGKIDRVAITNLSDIAFNDKGEILGWYTKIVKGTDYTTEGTGFFGLFANPNQTTNPYVNKPNLISAPSALIPQLKGTLKINLPKLQITGTTQTPMLEGTFTYVQGTTQVSKHYVIHPRRFTIELDVTVDGLSRYDLEFIGLGGGKPQLKALEKNATTPLEIGEVKNFVYTSMQCCTNAFGHPGEAIIIQQNPLEKNPPPVLAQIGTRLEDKVTEKGTEKVERAFIRLSVTGNSTTKFQIYGGFNELVRLELEGYYGNLPGLFQPNIFGQISLLLIRLLRFLHEIVGSWGLAIIALTVLLRALMWPLMQTQLRSSAEMQAVQPEMVKLREQYKDNPMKLQEATTKLYQEHGINPFAGCLPIFLQMPILIVLWRVVSNFEFDQGFLWLKDLSLPDTIPNGLFILPVLYVAVNIAQTYYLTRSNPETFRTQLIIQVVFVYLVLSFPSGVTLYYVLSTMIQVAQQWLINRSLRASGKLKPVIAAVRSSSAIKTVNAKISEPKKK